jgi:hypothetical protein
LNFLAEKTMKKFDYYERNSKLYVNGEEFTTVYVYYHGECISSQAAVEFVRGEWYTDALVERVLDERSYHRALAVATEVRENTHKEFKDDLYREFHVQDNPKREMAFALAWEYGHIKGYEFIYNYFKDIVTLIQ